MFFSVFLSRPNSQDAKDVNLGTQGAEIAKKVVDDQYKALGPVTWHETVSIQKF